MTCEQVRDAISAGLDGEDLGISPKLMADHIDSCPACSRYRRESTKLRRSMVRVAEPVPDLVESVLRRAAASGALAEPAERTPKVAKAPIGAHWTRWVLLGVALLHTAFGLSELLGLGATGGHGGRELGAWCVALGAALLVVAVDPRRAAGLLPFAVVLAVVMAGTAVIDVVAGRTGAVDETQHALEIIGVALLWSIAGRDVDREPLFGTLARPGVPSAA